jgi:hypothetical protein
MTDNQLPSEKENNEGKTLTRDRLGMMLLDIIDHLPTHVQESVRAANGLGPPGPFLPVYVLPLTLSEYLDSKRFPITTVEDLTPIGQITEDSIRYRNMWEYLFNGGKLTAPKRKELVELMRKIPNQPRVILELPKGAA